MARNAGTAVEQNFVNGLITEATGMNFPENACTDALNVIFKETGEVTRRLGLDYESSYSLNTVTRSSDAIVEFEWSAAGGNGDVTFIVQQIGLIIYFYRIVEGDSLSDNKHATTFDLTTYQVSGAPDPGEHPCGFASGKGYLFVTNKHCEPFYISYDPDANTFAGTQITIQCRDFEGVDDGLEPNEKLSTLSDAHEYNLYNQGWGEPHRLASGSDGNVVTYYRSFKTVYPSNAEQWWLMKDTTDEFNPNKYATTEDYGNSQVPKGHYILNWFNTDRSGAHTDIGTVTERTAGDYRPTSCAFFAGRVWYAGVESSDYVGEVYYSQIIERADQLGQCYQANDPTAEHLSDLLDTDGGIARVLDIGTVHKMFSSQKALIIFASNGIWSISGSDVASFKATDYTIKKISSISVTSGLSLVDALGTPIFWTEDGIWTVAYENGDFTVISLSDKKIKQFFKDIPRGAKSYAKGVFNNVDKLIQWVYSSTAPVTVDDRYEYDKILTLNTITGAFYPWDVTSSNKTMNGITIYPGGVFKYFVTKNTSGSSYASTFYEENNTSYLDYDTDGENVDYSSYFMSGYRVHAEVNKEYQANFVTFVCTDATGSSAFVQGIWDYANNTLSKKWTTAQQIYNSTPTYRDYRIRRIKIRGWGKALQFRVYGATGLPFNIVGWSSFETSNIIP